MKTPRRAIHRHGFSAIELIMAIALSGILVVGLTVMIDVPNQMAATQNGDNPSVASADVSLSALERDIRFATNATMPSAKELVLAYSDGKSVNWRWTGDRGGSLRRTDIDGTVNIVNSVAEAQFGLRTETMIIRRSDDQPIETNNVVLGTFSAFTLNPGFVFGASAVPPLTAVVEQTQLCSISLVNRCGFYITPQSLSGSEAFPTTLRLRMQRDGTANVNVIAYEAIAGTKIPDRFKPVAFGMVWNRQIPVTLGEVVIPLSMRNKISGSKTYFVELSGGLFGTAAKIEAKTLSRPAAAASQPHAFLVSTNGGMSFTGLATTLDASQAVFALEGVRTSVAPRGSAEPGAPPPGYQKIDVTVGVTLKLALITPQGDQAVSAAFPLENNACLVKR